MKKRHLVLSCLLVATLVLLGLAQSKPQTFKGIEVTVEPLPAGATACGVIAAPPAITLGAKLMRSAKGMESCACALSEKIAKFDARRMGAATPEASLRT